jgi:hypothetical protein
MSIIARFPVLALAAALALPAGRPPDIPFERHTLDLGANEACAFADVNGDGKLDIISGENWYEAPGWKKHRFRTLFFSNNYIDDFSDLPLDVDGDGHIDIITATWFSKKLSWWKNPGRGQGTWTEHEIDSGHNTEFAFLVDIDNDGQRREVLPQYGGKNSPLAWYEFRGGKWVRHVVSPNSYGHGIGAGDVNGDGRTDILTPKGWFEAPADPRQGEWKHHPAWDSDKALGFIYVHDVNGDGRPDVITSHAHDYGIFWLEATAAGEWKRHMIDESWSQAHAVTLVDLNGDGKMDLLTGKRYMAHNGRDPGGREPLGVYWYEILAPASGGPIEWVRHVIDYGGRAGGGMQIPVADLDGDGDPDFAVAGKSGLFLFENKTR